MYNSSILTLIIVFLYITYDTDALPYYLKLISDKFFKVTDFFNFRKTSPIQLSYLEYIEFKLQTSKKFSFWTKLFSCPNCMIVWICFLTSFLCNDSWKDLGAEIIIVWVGYAALRRILKELYE